MVGQGSTASEIQIGQHCFVQLVRMAAKGGSMPVDTSIHYNVAEATGRPPPEGEVQVLPNWSLEAFVPVRDIAMAPDARLPCFTIAYSGSSEAELRILFSSCRKPHGLGKDAFRRAWSVPDGTRADALHCNLLIGDQIYADDVSSLLLPSIRLMAAELIGPDGVPAHLLGGVDLDATNSRAKLVREAGMTSDAAANHLITFGEFVCMYVLVFGASRVRQRVQLAPPKASSALDAAMVDEYELLKVWRDAGDDFAKVLANCPTYMIFDDHEVSDDWNLTADWLVRDSRKALRDQYIVRHALYAYFLFQGWGNDPSNAQWSEDTLGGLSLALKEHRKRLEAGLSPALTDLVSDWDWSYRLPCRVASLVLDTRTGRDRIGVGIVREVRPSAPGVPVPADGPIWDAYATNSDVALMGYDIVQSAKKIARTRSDSDCRTLLLVSACPVLGNSVIQSAQRLGQRSFADPLNVYSPTNVTKGLSSAANRDEEDWLSHPASMLRLAELICDLGVGNLIILGGDIHAGYLCSGTILYRGRSINFFQLVGSASQNQPGGQIRALTSVGQLMGLVARRAAGFKLWAEGPSDLSARQTYVMATSEYGTASTIARLKRPPDLEVTIRDSRDVGGLLMQNNLGYLTIGKTGGKGFLLGAEGSNRCATWNLT